MPNAKRRLVKDGKSKRASDAAPPKKRIKRHDKGNSESGNQEAAALGHSPESSTQAVDAKVSAATMANDAEARLAAKLLDHRASRVRAPDLRVTKTDQGTSIELGHTETPEALAKLQLLSAFGTASTSFASWAMLGFANATAPRKNEPCEAALNAAMGALNGMQASDEVEALLISQMLACHHQAMTGLGRMRGAETIDQLNACQKAANAFMRTFTTQVEALKRYRSKGEQTMRVERVYVGEGGQAIVGQVSHQPNGLTGKTGRPPTLPSQETPNVRAIEAREEPALPCSLEADRGPVQAHGDAR